MDTLDEAANCWISIQKQTPCDIDSFLCQVDTLDEAIALVNSNKHGNGTAVFTGSGAAARKFQNEIDVGMVGVGGCGGWIRLVWGDCKDWTNCTLL